MQNNNSFIIYNASAGSGKTYTLVKEYLKLLFASNNHYLFKNILAITFTNKAVAEMKERIIDTLKTFDNKDILENPNTMFSSICKELQIDPVKLHEKAKKLLNIMMHNYASFDISTIDGFTHKLIRTFAHDLKLPMNFEVELDQESLLNEAVDSLIAKAGTDTELTKVLVDFAIEKADDDKSWDVAFDFYKISKLLTNENDIPFINTLKDKTLADFKALKTQLKNDISNTEKHITKQAQSVLNLIAEAGLEHSDFTRGTLPNHFKKVVNLDLDKLYDNKLGENITERTGIYNKTLSPDLASTIDAILPTIETAYKEIKTKVFQLKFLKNFYKNITPLSVLNAINNELKALKEEQNKMLISEFNTIISNEIKEQPTPFIYERIGEKFNHYFIDEFQDTSVMQWENLLPLLDNALANETGSTMLVGDAKQAIYRWRGGKAEQFIELFNLDKYPFSSVNQSVENLKSNFRSCEQVIAFNNGFFKFLSETAFKNPIYGKLYESSSQNIEKKDAGYVHLNFLEIEKEDDRDELFSEAVLKTIDACLQNAYALEDICVLVRKNKEGVAVANYLIGHNIPIISSETLLLSNSPEVMFINNMMGLLVQPKNNELKISVLNYLTTLFNIENKHEFFCAHLNLPIEKLFESFKTYNVIISSENLLQLPLYDVAETLVRNFNLVESSNAYVQFYLDVVLEFTQQKGSDISGFLNHFNKKKDKLSVVSPIGQKAVQIMTIHKSKGLEFPVVIFPYADLDIYREIDAKEWFPLNEENYLGFSQTLLNYNSDFENYGEEGAIIYAKHQSELELDNINLLYVALTRAEEQLFIISKRDLSVKGIPNEKKYSGLLINYLQHLALWNDNQLIYSFGNPNRISKKTESSKEATVQKAFISTAKEDHNIKVVTKSGLLWDTNQEEAIEKGNLIHDLLSKIKTAEDIDFVIHDFITASLINENQAITLKSLVLQIINHSELKDYYTSNYTIYNERDIISKHGEILRPDRVVIKDNNAFIIDYKTGAEDKKHLQQLQLYQDVLQDMNLSVKKKILVYINDDIQVKDV